MNWVEAWHVHGSLAANVAWKFQSFHFCCSCERWTQTILNLQVQQHRLFRKTLRWLHVRRKNPRRPPSLKMWKTISMSSFMPLWMIIRPVLRRPFRRLLTTPVRWIFSSFFYCHTRCSSFLLSHVFVQMFGMSRAVAERSTEAEVESALPIQTSVSQ